RESCRDQALASGAAGWGRNLEDGRVEVVLEGPPPALHAVVAWGRDGPPRARVHDVEVLPGAPVGEQGLRGGEGARFPVGASPAGAILVGTSRRPPKLRKGEPAGCSSSR